MEKQYIRSERAHYMCPNMYFGIDLMLNVTKDFEKVQECMDIIAKAHPFLRSRIKYDKDSTDIYYDIQDISTIELNNRGTADTMWDDYKSVGDTEWNIFDNGLLKVFAYDNMRVLFVAHHLLGDGRCLLELVNEFANLYVKGITPSFSEEHLIRGMDDLPEKSDLSGISKYLVNRLNKQWVKDGKTVTYNDYKNFYDGFVKNNPVSHEAVCSEDLSGIKAFCNNNQVTINDYLMAKMYIKMGINKIIIAADVRNKLKCYNVGAYGNYSTAMGIVCKNKSGDIVETARQVHRIVKKNVESNRSLILVLSCYLRMNKDLIDAAAISSLGDYKSKAGEFVGSNMFGYSKRDGVSLTNLGCIDNDSIINAKFIPPASPATIQTIGVLTVNGKMNLCSSYYEKAVSAKEVSNLLGDMSQCKQ